jgi:hypothetical protein
VNNRSITAKDTARSGSSVRVHVEMRSKRELWVKPSLNSMKEGEEEMLAKG